MKNLPTTTALRHLTGALANLNQRPKPGQPTRLDHIERRLITAVDRDRTGSPTPDGYPTGTLGGGGTTTDSTVEAAAIALLDGATRDRHHDLTTRAVTALTDAVTALNTLVAALDSIDDNSTTSPAPRLCAHCTPFLPEGHTREVHRRSTVGDRLATAIDLCQPCYFYVARTAKPGTQAGALPSPNQIRWHDQHGTWRVRVA